MVHLAAGGGAAEGQLDSGQGPFLASPHSHLHFTRHHVDGVGVPGQLCPLEGLGGATHMSSLRPISCCTAAH